MKALKWIITRGCRLGLAFAYRIDDAEVAKVGGAGPLIAFSNHRGLLEAPIIYTSLYPRPHVSSLAKAELWKSRFFAFIAKVWEVIPVRRGESDMEAMRTCVERLKAGYILGIAPEGTRSRTGALQRAQIGITLIALHSGAPLQPIAHWEDARPAGILGRLGRKPFHIRVGRAFRLDAHGQRVTKEMRQEMADEIMYQLAPLLPEGLRGEYTDPAKASARWLAFGDEGQGD